MFVFSYFETWRKREEAEWPSYRKTKNRGTQEEFMKHQKKMKKVLKVVATAALGGLVALSVFPTSEAKAATVDFNNLQPIQQFPGAAETDYVLNDYKASDKVPAGFTFFERFGA